MQKCAMKESTWKDNQNQGRVVHFLLYHGRRIFFLEWNYSVGILKLFIILFIYHFHCLSLSLSGAVVYRCEKRSQQEIWTFAVIVQYTKIVWKPTHLTVSKMLCLIFFFFLFSFAYPYCVRGREDAFRHVYFHKYHAGASVIAELVF